MKGFIIFRFFFILLFVYSNNRLECQDIPKINQLDSLEKKQGLWKVEQDSIIIYCYYKNGFRHGVYHSYYNRYTQFPEIDSCKMLFEFGEYQKNVRTGIWYEFYNNGLLRRKGFYLGDTSFVELKDKKPKKYSDKLNQYTSRKRKHGLWIEKNSYGFRNYHNGKLEGIIFEYGYSNNFISDFGNFKNNNLSGNFYIFIKEKFVGIDKIIHCDYKNGFISEFGQKIDLPVKSYGKLFYSNGQVKSEGIIFSELDKSVKTSGGEENFDLKDGEWKYYDETGKMIKRTIYDLGKVVKTIDY